jgi:acyl-CoA synthetase (NDP forming)/RimJ/RimL family protein N-acetyltransferase
MPPSTARPAADDSADDNPGPAHWEADVVVSDGAIVHLRPIQPSDAEALVAFHTGLSSRTRYLRYFSAYPRMSTQDVYRFTHVDHHDRVNLVVLLAGQIIAVGLYEREPGTDEAEVAFVVADAHQGRGIGSVLLEHLAAAARERGLRRFTAVVLAENQAMLRVFRDAGYEIARQHDGGEVTLQFDVDETALTESVMRDREQRAEARSIRRLLFPSSVAVVGASSDPTKIGHAMFVNLLRMGFEGTIYPVNATAQHVSGVRAYPSVLDVPEPIDLVVIATPAAGIPELVEQCIARQVRGLIVVAGGYGERGTEEERRAGLQAQRELVAAARSGGMRVIGPNCLGIVNTAESVRLNASLAPTAPLAGRAGFFCQSGALGAAVLGEAARRGLGVSTFVSAGNRADVSGNDLLQYWETDDDTDIALLYLESFGNPRKFARLARRLGRRKPIVAVKSGRGAVVPGLDSTSVDVPEVSVQALFEASGVIRVDTLGGLFDVALLLTSQPLPAGDRLAVVGNSTAIGVLVADAARLVGLRLSEAVDVGVDAAPADFGAAVARTVRQENVDAVVAVFVPPVQRIPAEEYALELRQAVADTGKPVLTTFLGFEGVPAALAAPGPSAPSPGSVPSYPTPERAVRALARAVRYAHWRARPIGTVPELSGVDPDAARALVEGVLAEAPAGRELTAEESRQLGSAYGIDIIPSWDVTGLVEAVQRAAQLDGPLAIKVPGAVRLHLTDADAIRDAWNSLGLGENATATLQVMAPRGVDVVFEVRDDQSFGALVSFGVGGVATELLDDRAYAAVPLTTADAQDLIRAPRAAPLLTGYGGAPPARLDALTELALRLSALSDDLPEVLDLWLAGVAAPDGASVIGASARLVPYRARSDTGPRRVSIP